MEKVIAVISALLSFGATIGTQERCIRLRLHWGKAHFEVCIGYGCATPPDRPKVARKPRTPKEPPLPLNLG